MMEVANWAKPPKWMRSRKYLRGVIADLNRMIDQQARGLATADAEVLRLGKENSDQRNRIYTLEQQVRPLYTDLPRWTVENALAVIREGALAKDHRGQPNYQAHDINQLSRDVLRLAADMAQATGEKHV